MSFNNRKLGIDEAIQLFRDALAKHQEFRVMAKSANLQYESGLTGHKKDEDMKLVYNFTAELIDAQVAVDIPLPMVIPRKKTQRNMMRARVITSMLRNEIDRMPTETLNDLIERQCRIVGGASVIVEWDKKACTHNTVGEVSFQEISAADFIPQPDISDTNNMDYCFIVRDVTKRFVVEQYGKKFGEEMELESVDSEVSEASDNDDIVTLVLMYYKLNGVWAHIAFVNDVELINVVDYYGRKDKVCSKCEKTQSGKECVCGSKVFVMRDREGESVAEDFITGTGVHVLAQKPLRDENGNYLMQIVEVPVIDDEGNVTIEASEDFVMGENKIPYYKMKKLPIAIRRNGTQANKLFGGSDALKIKSVQEGANIATTKIAQKQVSTGNIFTKPDSLDFDLSNTIGKVLNIESPEQINMIKAITLSFSASEDYQVVQQCYNQAKSMLAVTDSFLGKPDTTSQSGRAKEAQIAQASGIQRAKSVLKNVFWQDFYESMFYMMLSFCDEPRSYNAQNDDGEDVEVSFNRYDFLEVDEFGNLYYEDGFLFSVDETGVNPNNRAEMLQNVSADFTAGLYGSQDKAETLLQVWKEKELLNYPGASRQVAFWAKKHEEEKQLEQMAQQMQMQQNANNEMGGLNV